MGTPLHCCFVLAVLGDRVGPLPNRAAARRSFASPVSRDRACSGALFHSPADLTPRLPGISIADVCVNGRRTVLGPHKDLMRTCVVRQIDSS